MCGVGIVGDSAGRSHASTSGCTCWPHDSTPVVRHLRAPLLFAEKTLRHVADDRNHPLNLARRGP